ncbi:sce7725 family protein [Kushneria sp. Sum13]|uniref:sce7725 family protein n=1 Tax=Kushneria sp. Sum13 TaxID=3459196 RepID=UPI0040467376
MYYPILRGKQFELIVLREIAAYISPDFIRPVIEPVRSNVNPLKKTIETLSSCNITPLVVLNPKIGDFSKESYKEDLVEELQGLQGKFSPCFKVSTVDELDKILEKGFELNQAAVFVEGGVDKAMISSLNSAQDVLINKDKVNSQVFSLLNKFVLYSDSFDKKTRNADYKEFSSFSSLHVDWKNYGNAVGFGDYTILSEDYTEAGGPAYVVTIHLSYIDHEDFDSMYVKHFSSFDDGSPANPGGKFKSALGKVVEFVDQCPNVFNNTKGLEELLELYGNPYPGLGQVKKFTIKHHVETVCDFLRDSHV